MLSFGEKNVFYITGNNNHQAGNIYNYQTDKPNNIERLQMELEKAKTLLFEQSKKISHLKLTVEKLVEENKHLSFQIKN